MKRHILLLILLLVIGCGGTSGNESAEPPSPADTPIPPTPTPLPEPTADPLFIGSEGYPWWNDAVFYEVILSPSHKVHQRDLLETNPQIHLTKPVLLQKSQQFEYKTFIGDDT